VLESLTRGGVATVLFTEPPDAEMLSRYPHVRAIGVAGNSRTMSPQAMDAQLPAAFESLRGLAPDFVHYKVCSTFDSSPTIGSIGRAIDIGQRVFGNRVVPLIVGAPALERFCVFGNLFARSGLDSDVFRLDRHPTMGKHPVTPMNEADLRVHLSHQTERPMELVDVVALERAPDEALARATRTGGSVVLFDVLTEGHLARIGRLMCEEQAREGRPLFVAGSSGVENALVQHWTATGRVVPSTASPACGPVEQVFAVSGSCSPVTERQIAWALAHGFAEVPLDTVRLLQSSSLDAEIDSVVRRAASELAAGRSVIVHSSRGPEDDRIFATRQLAAADLTAERLGGILGRILRGVLRLRRVERVAVTGGDTSGYVARAAGIEALEMAGPLAPGAPLCIARSRHTEVDGIQFTFKGGQISSARSSAAEWIASHAEVGNEFRGSVVVVGVRGGTGVADARILLALQFR
jgi:3-oxoisoapionate kinase